MKLDATIAVNMTPETATMQNTFAEYVKGNCAMPKAGAVTMPQLLASMDPEVLRAALKEMDNKKKGTENGNEN